jgi:hypothetical protein
VCSNEKTAANVSGLSGGEECRLSEMDPSKPEARDAVPGSNDSMQAGITAETALQGKEQMMIGVNDHSVLTDGYRVSEMHLRLAQGTAIP